MYKGTDFLIANAIDVHNNQDRRLSEIRAGNTPTSGLLIKNFLEEKPNSSPTRESNPRPLDQRGGQCL